jgi:Steigviridae/Suoliviridae L,D-carboxypeptidase/transpeptidase
MKLVLDRLQRDSDVTIGSLSIDGDFECWICEDPVREVIGQSVASWKVKGQTAIPAGTYSVDITMSARFKRELPLLIAVPGFDGIRIHPGNTAGDTEGCLLPGAMRMAKSVGQSRLAFDALFAKLRVAHIRREPITIEVA